MMKSVQCGELMQVVISEEDLDEGLRILGRAVDAVA